ncbi:hypothetical protein KAU33_05635 [Candidatus Dependentiae bacterium]|nr:hypothetical protein [Candidatus Dependentiae bacterium]
MIILIQGDDIREYLNLNTIKTLTISKHGNQDDYYVFVDGSEKCLKLILGSSEVQKLIGKLKEVRKFEIKGKKLHGTLTQI